MFIEFLLLFIMPVIVLVTLQYLKHLISLRNYPKGPFPLPIIGNLHVMTNKPYKDFQKLANIYGDVFSISFGMTRCVVTNSVEAVKEALVTKTCHFAGRPTNQYTISYISRGNQDLSLSDYGPLWKMLRKLAHSSLRLYGENLEKFENWIVKESEELHKILLKTAGEAINPDYEIGCSILNIICKQTFGIRYQRNDEEFRQLIECQHLIFSGLGASDAVAYLPWLKIFPMKGLTKLKKGMAVRDPLFKRKLKEHRQTFDPENVRDFTDALIKLSMDSDAMKKFGLNKLTDDSIEISMFDFFSGGNETIQTTIRWFLVYMLHWTEYQDKMYEEMVSAIGTERYPSFKDRANLPFLQACIHETLRLGNLAALGLPRKTTENTSIDNKLIPKGTQVICNFWNLHMNEKYWIKPHEFNPYRWLNENGELLESSNLEGYKPFSAGIRGCPGESLARLELFSFTSRMIRDFRFQRSKNEPLPDLEGIFGLTLCPKPFQISFQARQNSLSNVSL